MIDELRAALPGIIGDLPLENAWAYKYEQGLRGIGIHADQAVVNLNLWLTPDDAHAANSSTGGMTVWLKEPPEANWSFAQYVACPVLQCIFTFSWPSFDLSCSGFCPIIPNVRRM